MKKIGVFLLVLLVLSAIPAIIVSAADDSNSPELNQINQIKNASGGIIDESGLHLDEGTLNPWKSKAEQRIEMIDKYGGPVTNILFASDISLSWIFLLSLILWVVLIIIITRPIIKILEQNALLALVIGIISSSIIMHLIGHPMIVKLDTLVREHWYYGIIIIAVMILISVIYQVLIDALGQKKKQGEEKQEKKDVKELKKGAERSKYLMGLNEMDKEVAENLATDWIGNPNAGKTDYSSIKGKASFDNEITGE